MIPTRGPASAAIPHMREKRKAPRFDLPDHPGWRIETDVLNGTDHGIVVSSRLPLVRRHSYQLDAGNGEIVATVEAMVLWSRQISAEPRYQVGFRWNAPVEPEIQKILQTAPRLRIGPLGGGVSGRIPWQSDFIRNAPPDRAFIARELSLSGMLMETAELDPPGDTFAVEIPVEGSAFRCLGRIVRTTRREPNREGYLHGVEFLDVEDEDLDRLRHLIDSAG